MTNPLKDFLQERLDYHEARASFYETERVKAIEADCDPTLAMISVTEHLGAIGAYRSVLRALGLLLPATPAPQPAVPVDLPEEEKFVRMTDEELALFDKIGRKDKRG